MFLAPALHAESVCQRHYGSEFPYLDAKAQDNFQRPHVHGEAHLVTSYDRHNLLQPSDVLWKWAVSSVRAVNTAFFHLAPTSQILEAVTPGGDFITDVELANFVTTHTATSGHTIEYKDNAINGPQLRHLSLV